MQSDIRFEVHRTSEATFTLFVYKGIYSNDGELESSTYRYNGSSIYITFKINCQKKNNERNIEFYIKSAVYDGEMICLLEVSLNSETNSFKRSMVTRITTDWTTIGDYNQDLIKDYKNTHFFNITIKMNVGEKIDLSTAKLFYDDEASADIKLRGEEEDSDVDADAASSVSFHRAVLANCSEMLRSMVSGAWREAKEGVARLPTDTDTLRHFKSYLYLRKLPHDGGKCSRLLSLANYCMMPELAAACTDIMAADTQPETTWNWLEHCVLTKDFSQLRLLARSFTEDRVIQMENMFKDKERAANESKDPKNKGTHILSHGTNG